MGQETVDAFISDGSDKKELNIYNVQLITITLQD